jgi:tetratricopeptide (TPR) repeat protein
MRTRILTATVALCSLVAIASAYAEEATWNQIYNKGVALFQQGDLNAAQERGQVARTEAEKRFGAESIYLVKALDLLANVARGQRDLSQAVSLYNRSLTMQEKLLGPTHPRFVKTICALGDLRVDEKNLFEAKALYQRAYQICEQTNRHDDLDTAVPVMGLARICRTTGHYGDCQDLCGKAIAIYSTHTKYQPNMAAHVSEAQQMLAEARALHEKVAQK